MGKLPTSLLIIVFELYLTNGIFADEEVRKVQEELRKRHLFYGNITGEFSSGLTAALTRYQTKKGFARTGIIDSETRSSLGIIDPNLPAGTPPIVVMKAGDVHGPNGESLPSATPFSWPNDEHPIQFDRAKIDEPEIGLAVAAFDKPIRQDKAVLKRRSQGRAPQVRARTETNPIVLAFHSADHAMKFLLGGETKTKKKRLIAKRL